MLLLAARISGGFESFGEKPWRGCHPPKTINGCPIVRGQPKGLHKHFAPLFQHQPLTFCPRKSAASVPYPTSPAAGISASRCGGCITLYTGRKGWNKILSGGIWRRFLKSGRQTQSLPSVFIGQNHFEGFDIGCIAKCSIRFDHLIQLKTMRNQLFRIQFACLHKFHQGCCG